MAGLKQQIQDLQRRLEELRRVGAELEAELAALSQQDDQATRANRIAVDTARIVQEAMAADRDETGQAAIAYLRQEGFSDQQADTIFRAALQLGWTGRLTYLTIQSLLEHNRRGRSAGEAATGQQQSGTGETDDEGDNNWGERLFERIATGLGYDKSDVQQPSGRQATGNWQESYGKPAISLGVLSDIEVQRVGRGFQWAYDTEDTYDAAYYDEATYASAEDAKIAAETWARETFRQSLLAAQVGAWREDSLLENHFFLPLVRSVEPDLIPDLEVVPGYYGFKWYFGEPGDFTDDIDYASADEAKQAAVKWALDAFGAAAGAVAPRSDAPELALAAALSSQAGGAVETAEGDADMGTIMAMLRDLQAQVSEAEQRNARLRGELDESK